MNTLSNVRLTLWGLSVRATMLHFLITMQFTRLTSPVVFHVPAAIFNTNLSKDCVCVHMLC